MSRYLGALAALCVVAVLAGDVGILAGATSSAYRPAVGFSDAEYSVPFYGALLNENDRVSTPGAVVTNGARFFGEVTVVEREGSSLDLSFAVEGQSEGVFHQACGSGEGCNDVIVRVTPEGVLYLYWPLGSQDVRVSNAYFGGFASRAVEVSASDGGSPLKVYREVVVDPPGEAAGCEDYDGGTPEAFTCLFMRELLPSGQAAAVDEAALRAKLPKLVQDRANYGLVFAEEFNGTPPLADANGCRDGMSTLDPGVWSYYDACDDVDSKGEPCGNVGDGGFTMGVFSSCGFSGLVGYLLGTHGHLHMKYGYIETRYTFNIDQWRDVYQNYNMILNVASGGLHYLRDQYGVKLENWEDYLKSSQVEIDIFESPSTPSPTIQLDVSHQYANWSDPDIPDILKPTRAAKFTQYCSKPATTSEWGIVNNPKTCTNSDTFTVTRGVEWTPRGYRTYIWVHGIQGGLTLLPKDHITVQEMRNGVALVLGSASLRSRFFENLVADDASTLLEKVGVSHIPMPIYINVWGWMVRPKEGEKGMHPHIRRRYTFDYVRIWKPENHYADMEPVYQ